jgi:hypothetical protein
MPQQPQFGANARRSPRHVLLRHAADQDNDITWDRRATGSAPARLPAPEHTEAATVPADHGLGLDEHQPVAPAGEPPRQKHPEEPVAPAQGRPWLLAEEHRELLTQSHLLGEQRHASQKKKCSRRTGEHS